MIASDGNESRQADLLKEFLSGVTRPGIVSAYLFGSHAEGRVHGESDVDIGLVLDYTVLPTARERFDFRIALTTDLIHALSIDEVDVVVLNDAPPIFARSVLSRGIPVFRGQEDKDRDFRRDVQLLAADMAPFLERHRQTKLDALAR